MAEPLRIYTDPAVQGEDLPLAPFLEGLVGRRSTGNPGSAWEDRFADWRRISGDWLRLVSLADAEVAVLATDWYWIRGPSWRSRTNGALLRAAMSFAQRVEEAGKRLLIFFSGDRSHEELPVRDAIVLREGTYRSRRGRHDIAMPAFCEDLAAYFRSGEPPRRDWQPRPVVGFCGLAGRRDSWADMGKRVVYHARMLLAQGHLDVSPYRGESLRARALELVGRESGLDTSFVIRRTGVFFRDAPPRDLLGVRREYVRNLAESDYVLCCRGSGNYSFRLYETLCMGRIPVFVDTDCVLPLCPSIDWRRHTVWVDESELDSLPEKVLRFHEALSPQAYRDLQKRNRELWRQTLSPSSFFKSIRKTLGL